MGNGDQSLTKNSGGKKDSSCKRIKKGKVSSIFSSLSAAARMGRTRVMAADDHDDTNDDTYDQNSRRRFLVSCKNPCVRLFTKPSILRHLLLPRTSLQRSSFIPSSKPCSAIFTWRLRRRLLSPLLGSGVARLPFSSISTSHPSLLLSPQHLLSFQCDVDCIYWNVKRAGGFSLAFLPGGCFSKEQ